MDKKSKSFFTKKKLFIFGGILVVLFLIIYVLCKVGYLYFYDIGYDDKDVVFNAISNRESIIIDHNAYDGKYFETKNIKFMDIFKDCYLNAQGKDSAHYICSNAAIAISKKDKFISGWYIDYVSLKHYNKKLYNEFLDRHNIKSDSDLIEFLGNYKRNPNSVISSYNDINDNYVVANIMGNFPTATSVKFYEISGDYSGYVLECDGNYMFYLKNGNNYYRITFGLNGSKISKDDIYKVISTAIMD